MYCSPPQPQRNLSRPQSFFGDYRPNMDALNSPVVDTSSPLPTNLSEFDSMTFDQMGISPGVPQTTGPAASEPSGSGPKGKGRAVSEGGGAYTEEESVAVAKAWVAVSEDPTIGTNQTEKGLWKRVAAVYEQLKPEGAVSRGGDQLRKKWDRIRGPVKRFGSIMDNLYKTVESGKSEADIRRLAAKMYKEGSKYTAFSCWEEYLILKDSPKFRVECETGDFDVAPKRSRSAATGPYSSGSGSGSGTPVIDLNDDNPPVPRRRQRPQGQQSAIRAARAARSSSASGSSTASMSASASSAASMPAFAPQVGGNNELLLAQHQRNLLQAIKQYRRETVPAFRLLLAPLIVQLCGQIGIPVPDLDEIAPPPPPPPPSDFDDVADDSEDDTEQE